MRARHPNKEIEAALSQLEAAGWTVRNAKGRSSHAWGFALCPANAGNLCRSGEFCRMSIWSTPRNPRAHARGLVSKAGGCVLREGGDDV
ncbi:MAG: hypothetical protein OXH14_12185 [Alphaproteobacteria bacterium]|nr:hypothetical protein [Alphaproteobacteria bacterium]